MSNNRLTFDGLIEFRTALRQLPVQLTGQAQDIVQQSAEAAASEVRTVYSAHRVTGDLTKGVSVAPQPGRFGAASVLKSRSPHAHLFEFGTQIRRNDRGANRGASPPHPTVIPIAQRQRSAMYGRLMDLLRSEGFEVSGSVT